MKPVGLRWIVYNTWLALKALASTPATPPATQLRIYAKLKAGVSTLYYLKDDGTEVEIAGVSGIITDHGALTGLGDDDHPHYRLESEDHTHQTTGLQGGKLDHGVALNGLADDDHTQYALADGSRGNFEAAGAVTTHEAAGDPHAGYALLAGRSGFATWENIVQRISGQNRFRHLNSMAVAIQAVAQTGLAANTWSTLVFGAEAFDTDTLHDNTTNNSRLTALITGKYLVFGTAYLDGTNLGAGATFGAIRFIKNGVLTTVYGNMVSAINDTFNDPSFSSLVIIDLVATDYVEMQGRMDSSGGGTFDIPLLLGITRFGMVYLGE